MCVTAKITSANAAAYSHRSERVKWSCPGRLITSVFLLLRPRHLVLSNCRSIGKDCFLRNGFCRQNAHFTAHMYRLNYASLTSPPISTASKLYPLKMLKMLHFIPASVFAMHDNFANASITLLWWRDKILLRAVTNSMELNVALAVLWKMIDVNVVFSNLNLFTATSTSSVK